MNWIRVEDFDETVEEFKNEIKKTSIDELNELESGFLWWDEDATQYVYLKIEIYDYNEKDFDGRLVWEGNGFTAYDVWFDIGSKEDIFNILNNIDDYFQ